MRRKPCEILFICTGNMCRSPMAEGILKALLSQKEISRIQVGSAGLMDSEGLPAAGMARMAAEGHGIPLEEHRTRFLNRDLLSHSDLVLVMEKAQEEEIRTLFPAESEKVFMLGSFGSDASGMDVEDPIGGGQELFDLCFQRIESEIRRILPHLMNWCSSKKRNRLSHENES